MNGGDYPRMLPNGNLLIEAMGSDPAGGVMRDGIAEVEPGSPLYEEYLPIWQKYIAPTQGDPR